MSQLVGTDFPGVRKPLLSALRKLSKTRPVTAATARRILACCELAVHERAADPATTGLTKTQLHALWTVLALNPHVVQSGGNRAIRCILLVEGATYQILRAKAADPVPA